MTRAALLATVVTFIAAGAVAASRINPQWFQSCLAAEDGPIESATVASLAIGCLVCLVRAWRIRLRNGPPFLAGLLGLAGAFFFGCGEEISWGQRLFDIRSPEWFRVNNLQGETNLHNLVVGGVKINVLLFSQAIAVMGALYFVLLPILTARNPRLADLADRWAIPVPTTPLIILTLGLAAVIATATATKQRHELLEMTLVSLLVIMVAWPRNAAAFQPGALDRKT